MSSYKPPLGGGGGGGAGGITVLSGQYQISGIYPASGVYQLSGAAGAGNSGSSFVGGIAVFSGNGSGTTYVITHGIGTTPVKFTAIPNSLDAMGDYRVEASGNSLSVIYTTARPSGTSNISLGWMADTQIVSGGVLGNNILVGGTALFSGNTSGTTFLINHNIGVTPSRYGVVPSTVDAVGDYRVEASGNTLSVIYTAARASGASNIGLVWFADTNNVSGGPADPLNVGTLNVSGTATFSGALIAQSGNVVNLSVSNKGLFQSGAYLVISGAQLGVSGGGLYVSGSSILMGASRIKFIGTSIFQDVDPAAGEGGNTLTLQAQQSGFAVGFYILPNGGTALQNVTATQLALGATDYTANKTNYEILTMQAFKGASGVSGTISGHRYLIQSLTDGVNGLNHAIEIGMWNKNNLIFLTDGTLNMNSMPLTNMTLGGQANLSGNTVINAGVIQGISGFAIQGQSSLVSQMATLRGTDYAGMTIRANNAGTDATARSVSIQGLDVNSDTFFTILTVGIGGNTLAGATIHTSGNNVINNSGGFTTFGGSGHKDLSGSFLLFGARGIFLGSGNAGTTIYNISHGIVNPASVSVNAASPQARATFDISGASGQIIVTYPVAPASGDVRLQWQVFA